MNTWILLFWLQTQSNGPAISVGTAEFNSEAACVSALAAWTAAASRDPRASHQVASGVCVSKS
jgi:hypothetical protein